MKCLNIHLINNSFHFLLNQIDHMLIIRMFNLDIYMNDYSS